MDESVYGVDGEFYFIGKGLLGQDREDNIVDYNRPPSTQPGLWCQWELVHDQDCDEWFIQWDGGEKFYNYIEWLEYIIEKVLKPEGLVLQGEITWQGEDRSDMGKIEVSSNVIRIRKGTVTYR